MTKKEKKVVIGMANPLRDFPVATEAIVQKFQALDYEGLADLTTQLEELKKEIGAKDAEIKDLKEQITNLEAKVEEVQFGEAEEKTIDNLEEVTGQTVVKINGGEVSAKEVNLNCKSALIKEATVKNNPLKITAKEDVTLENVTCEEGTYTQQGIHAICNIDAERDVVIKDCTLQPTEGYNGIEIGLAKPVRNVNIENVTFKNFTHNAINVFDCLENAVITIKGCTFENTEGLLRITNKSKNKVTYNITDCICKNWELGDEHAGPIVLQGELDSFAPDKVIINITNLIGPNGKVTETNAKKICATKDDNQILYIYDEKETIVDYDKEKYPTLNVK